MKALSEIGRWLFAVPFIFFGILYVGSAEQMALYYPGFISNRWWVYLLGLMYFTVGICLGIRRYEKTAAMGLGCVLTLMVLGVYVPNLFLGPAEATRHAVPNILKDIALTGAALMIAGRRI